MNEVTTRYAMSGISIGLRWCIDSILVPCKLQWVLYLRSDLSSIAQLIAYVKPEYNCSFRFPILESHSARFRDLLDIEFMWDDEFMDIFRRK